MIACPQHSVQSKVLVTFHGSVPARCERRVHQKLSSHSFALAHKTARGIGNKHARHRFDFSKSNEVRHKVRTRSRTKRLRLFEPIASKLPTRLHRSTFKGFNVVKHKDQEWNKDKKIDRLDHDASKLPTRLRRSPLKGFKVVKKHISHPRDGSTKGRHKKLTHLCLFY